MIVRRPVVGVPAEVATYPAATHFRPQKNPLSFGVCRLRPRFCSYSVILGHGVGKAIRP